MPLSPDFQPTTLKGFDYFWQYTSQRQQIYYLQLAGKQPPFSDDPILNTYRFTNVYRATDRVSQYLINHVQYNQAWDWLNTFARTMIFKLFNRIDTWQYLVSQLGQLKLDDLLSKRIDRTLEALMKIQPLYNPAYVMPPYYRGRGLKYIGHLDLLRLMIKNQVPQLIQSAKTMEEAFLILRSYHSIGDFLAYQFIIDLNYSPHLQFSENDFVVAGPGSLRGLRKCFANVTKANASQFISWATKNQDEEFRKRKLPWQNLRGRPMQLIDIQNVFCEVDKYTRLAAPSLNQEILGKRPKQYYRPSSNLLTANFPSKWLLSRN
ncbi:MAG: putative DNA base hypermodification protein [Candidatus Saccharibacteria bacterium]|nr:putative DNA base hypermodification protein [Candidatus Saccharibacteria bacterium]